MNHYQAIELQHYGVLGMKWGVRKKNNRVKSSRSKKKNKEKSSLNTRIKKKLAKVDKEKVKNIAKSSAKVAGAITATALLGYTGSVLYSNIMREREAALAKEAADKPYSWLSDEAKKSIVGAVTGESDVRRYYDEEDKKSKTQRYMVRPLSDMRINSGDSLYKKQEAERLEQLKELGEWLVDNEKRRR